MYRLVTTMVLLAAVLGCGRKLPPPPAVALDKSQAADTSIDSADGEEPSPIGPLFQGQDAAYWGRQLESRNAVAQSEASAALAKLGGPGWPYLLRGLKSSSDKVRLVSLQALDKPALVKRGRETMPLVLGMLAAQDPTLRQAAAARLPWFGDNSRQVLEPLERLARQDTDPEVREVAEAAIAEIKDSSEAKE